MIVNGKLATFHSLQVCDGAWDHVADMQYLGWTLVETPGGIGANLLVPAVSTALARSVLVSGRVQRELESNRILLLSASTLIKSMQENIISRLTWRGLHNQYVRRGEFHALAGVPGNRMMGKHVE